jgi:RecB family exonuclease
LTLVPTERHAAVERLSLSKTSRDRVTTTRAFVHGAAAALAPEVRLASETTCLLATVRALEGVTAMRVPLESNGRVGLAAALDRAIGRARRAGISAVTLRGAGDAGAPLASVMTRVDEVLAQAGVMDARGVGHLVARRLSLASDDALDELLASEVVVRGALDFGADDLDVMEALHTRLRALGSRGVRVVLPRIDGLEEDPTSPIADVLERRWASLLDAPEIVWAAPRDVGEATNILTAKTADGEARALASEVLAALERGTPPERIAIVVPSLEEASLAPLRAALSDANAPFCEPRGRAVATSPEARIVMALLSMATGPVRRDDVIDLLRAPGVDPAYWMDRHADSPTRSRDLAHRLTEVPVAIDRAGAQLATGLAEVLTSRAEDAKKMGRAAHDEAWMSRALDRVLVSARWIGEAETLGAIAARTLEVMNRIRLGQPSAAELAASLEAPGIALGALGAGARSARAVRTALTSIAAADAALGASKSDPAALQALLARELESGSSSATGAPRTASITIGRAADLAGLEHEVLLVSGLGERAYAGNDDDASGLGDRAFWDLAPAIRPPRAPERAARELSELSFAIACAARVTLSWVTSEAAELSTPHPLVQRARKAAVVERVEPASRLARAASRPNARSAELVALAANATPPADVAARVVIERARAAFFLDPRAPATAFTGSATPRTASDAARLRASIGGDSADHSIAVTAIELTAKCAFAGFAKRVLRARRVDEIFEPTDARERGTIVHRAVHAAYEAASAIDDDDFERAREVATEAAQRAVGLGPSLTPLRYEALSQAARDAVSAVMRGIESGDRLRFAWGERRFGPGQPWGALEIADAPNPSVFVDGQIDRIDRSADGLSARVVDYKTGSKKTPKDDHGRTAFQLPLYAAVVGRALGIERVQALYVGVAQRGVVTEWPVKEEDRLELGGLGASAMNEARRLVLAMWRGEVAPRPRTATQCDRCEARDICRRPAVAPVEEVE